MLRLVGASVNSKLSEVILISSPFLPPDATTAKYSVSLLDANVVLTPVERSTLPELKESKNTLLVL